MTRTQISTNVSERTRAQADELTEKLGYSLRDVISIAIDRMYEKESKMYFKIDSKKLEKVTALFNDQVDPKATEHLVEKEICADWHEGQEHQDWIVTASVQEIVDWLASFYE